MACLLSDAGASLILSTTLAWECRARGVAAVEVLPLDVSAPEPQLERAVQQMAGRVYCAVLNAGQGHLSLAQDTSVETTERVMQVNAMAPMMLARLLLQHNPQWKERQRQEQGHLVVMASVASLFAVPLSSSYAASKHAVRGYFETLRAQFPWLRIDLPCPGPIQTDFHQHHQSASTTHAAIATTNGGTSCSSSHEDDKVREMKMPVERCARLMVSSMMMRGRRHGGETWIAQQPTLFFCYLHQYLPSVSRWMMQHVLAPTRIGMHDAGLNVYDPKSIRAYRALQQKERQRRANKNDSGSSSKAETR